MKPLMRTVVPVLAAALAAGAALAAEPSAAPPKKLNVVLVTGGHGFDRPAFLKVFEGYPDIACTHVPLKAGGELFDDISNWAYDAIVLYNFNQKITEPQRENFLKLLHKGVGLLVLHHANAAYPDWPEYGKIAGLRFFLKPVEEGGVQYGRSTASGGKTFKVHVADPAHPITRGLADYEMADETYGKQAIDPSVHVLLTTDEPSSDKQLAWVKTYARANVCYLQSGHDAKAYTNPAFRTLVSRAIRWVAGRPAEPAASAAPSAPAAAAGTPAAPRLILAAPAAEGKAPAPAPPPADPAKARKIKAVVVTGGHAFDQKAFLAVFDGHADITYVHAPQRDHSELFEDIKDWPYDVIVFYHMTGRISEQRQKNFLALLEKGVGVVALHHALAAWPDWPDYKDIIGGKFYLKDTDENGIVRPKSTYKHDVDFTVRIQDPNHPVTAGLKDFTIHDETYKGYRVEPDVHVLLTTDEPTCEKAVGWCKTYRKARTCFLLLGHDGKAFACPAYPKLAAQAIRWAARPN